MTDHQEPDPQIVKEGEVLFVIRRTDLNRAVREAQTNCRGNADADTVYLLVSEYAITVRTLGMESEYPVDGIRPGTFETPIAPLRRITNMRTTKKIALHVQQGAISSGSSTVRHPAIRLSVVPDVRVSVPVDVSEFDLLVIGRLLGQAELERQGLSKRVAKSRERLQRDLATAAALLTKYRVGQPELQSLIDRLLRDAEPTVKAAIYA